MEYIDAYSWQIILGVLGPALVGAVTGLRTPGWVKALIALVVVTLFTAFAVYQAGSLNGQDVMQSVIIVIVVWQAFYGMLWKGTGIADWLQENFPIKLGEAKPKG